MRISDWSSDVCSSDLQDALIFRIHVAAARIERPVGGRREIELCLDTPDAAVATVCRDGRRPVLERQLDAVILGVEHRDVEASAPVEEFGLEADFRRVALFRAEGRSGRSEEHTSELQSLMRISYAVLCLK